MAVKRINKIGSRGNLFTFDDEISVYLIETDGYWFLCDTHLGPDSMERIKQHIWLESHKKAVIVFNSHSDWDHVWGNCAFEGAMIIAHETCRKRLQEIGSFELSTLAQYHCGEIELVVPNVTFSDKMIFAEEDIEFIYAPGHTVDSSLCFDKKDSVLFVGDLVEDPIPYLDFHDLEVYLETLEFIKHFPAKVKISAHSGIVDHDLIERNITYVRKILQGEPIHPRDYRESGSVHRFNSNNRLFLQYEKIVREKLGDNFNYTSFKSNFGDLKEIGYEDLQESLHLYIANL